MLNFKAFAYSTLMLSFILVSCSPPVLAADADQIYTMKIENPTNKVDSGSNYFKEELLRISPGIYALVEKNLEILNSVEPSQINDAATYNQSLMTNILQHQHMTNMSAVMFLNSIGLQNSQVFFTELENQIAMTFLNLQNTVEDILLARLYNLAHLTAIVIYDDNDRERSQNEDIGINPKNNAQFNQLIQFKRAIEENFDKVEYTRIMFDSHLRIVAMEETFPFKDQTDDNMDSIEHDQDQLIIDFTSDAFNEASPFLKRLIVKQFSLSSLDQFLTFAIKENKNTTFYSDISQTAALLPQARISFKYYTFRFPELHPNSTTDNMKIYYDENSIHYKELHPFDDLIKQINEEKEVWPGIVLDSQTQDKVTPANQNSEQTCQVSSNKFMPPYGSFQREIFLGPSVHMFPVEEIEIQEQQRVMNTYFEYKSLHNNLMIFHLLTEYLQEHDEAKIIDVDQFNSLIFTYEDPKQVLSITQQIKPINIDDLPNHNLDKAFFGKVSIMTSKIIKHEPLHLLRPKMMTITIQNTNSIKSQERILIKDVITSSPEITIQIEEREQFPFEIEPKEKVEIKVIITPHNIGAFQTILYVVFDERVYCESIDAIVGPNNYGLNPIYYPSLRMNEEISHALVISNPHPKQIFVEEFYLTNSKFKAEFKKINSSQKQSKPNFIIEANSNRTFCNINFKADSTYFDSTDSKKTRQEFEETTIVIKLSNGDFFRVPMYTRTRNLLIDTFPSLIDFGLVQVGQKPIQIDVYARFDHKKVKKVEDYLLPLDQSNLDFRLNHPPKDLIQSQAMDKHNGRIFVGSVILYAQKSQLIVTSIKVKIQTFENLNDRDQYDEIADVDECTVDQQLEKAVNHTLFVEIPIIASVVNHTNPFSAMDPNFKGIGLQQQVTPMQRFDILSTKSASIPVYGSTRIESLGQKVTFPLLIKNNMFRQIEVNKLILHDTLVYNYPQEFDNRLVTPSYVSDYHAMVLRTGQFNQDADQNFQYGEFLLRQNMSFGQGYQMMWFMVNNVITQAQVVEISNNLYCNWLNDTSVASLKHSENIFPCQSNTELNFGDVAEGALKSKVLRITNINAIPINIKEFIKNQVDDVSIDLIKVVDSKLVKTQATWKENQPEITKSENIEIFNQKRSRKTIDLILMPLHSALLSFKVRVNHQKVVESKIEIKFKPTFLKSINITYSYVIHEGSLTIQPNIFKFQPAFQNMEQAKVITVGSNFSIPIELISIKSPDNRIEARLLDKDIKPFNVSIKGILNFDPGKTGMERRTDFIKAISQFSIENPPLLKIDAVNLSKMQKKNGKNGQALLPGKDLLNMQNLSNKEILQMIKDFEPHLKGEGAFQNIFSVINMNLKDQVSDSSLKDLHSNVLNIPIKEIFRQQVGNAQRSPLTGTGQSNRQNTGLFGPVEKEFNVSDSLNKQDLLVWRDRQQEWLDMQRLHQTHINTTLEIQTSLIDKILVPVEAELKKPQIAVNNTIDFGPLQVGHRISKDVVLFNPTSETIQVQLFISYDLDRSFISKESDQEAWVDPGSFKDRMLREIDLFMRGVNLELIDQVEPIFEELQEIEKTSGFVSRSESQDPDKPKKNIVDILVTYSKLNQEDRHFEVDQMLLYYQQFKQDLRQNYVAKYCLQIFINYAQIQDFDSFRTFFEETTQSLDDQQSLLNQTSFRWYHSNKLLIGEQEKPIEQCLNVIQYIQTLEKQILRIDNQDPKEDDVFYIDEEDDARNHDHQFTIKSIQNFYHRLYLNVFDFDWKINQSMQKCNLTMQAENLDKLTTFDEITQVMRSIYYYDYLQTWKRQRQSNSRYFRSQLEAQALGTGPLVQFQERFIYYVSKIIPFSHPMFDRYIAREERKTIENNISKLIKAQQKFRNEEVQLDLNSPDQIEKVIRQVWDEDIKTNQEVKDRQYRDSYGNSNMLTKLNKISNEVLQEIIGLLGRLIAYDKYSYLKVSQSDSQSIINPLSSIHDRYNIHNQNLQKAVFRNNVQQQLTKIGKNTKHMSLPIQNFYLNPDFKEKVYDIPPRQNITLKNAIIFEPQIIEQNFSKELKEAIEGLRNQNIVKPSNIDQLDLNRMLDTFISDISMLNQDIHATPMQILVKNNLTVIDQINLEGFGTSGLLELTSIKKKISTPQDRMYNNIYPQELELVDVADMHRHKLIAMNQIEENAMLNLWVNQDAELKKSNKFINVDKVLRQSNSSFNLKSLTMGSDFFLNNHLFDQKTIDEWQRVKDKPNRPYSIVDQIVEANYRHKNYFNKKDRQTLSLAMQSFQNYIPFNIPITDIFVRTHETNLKMVDGKPVTETHTGPFYIQNLELTYPEQSIEYNGSQKTLLEERQRQLEEQQQLLQDNFKKFKYFINAPDFNMKDKLKHQIAQSLGRWDNTDFRVDINWTDFEYHVLRSKVKLVREHTRHLIFTNAGTVPMYITKISVDGAKNKKCSDFWEVLKVINCKDLIGRRISPNSSVEVVLRYFEHFQFLNTQKTLTIETEHFAQNFYLDFSISQRAQNLAHSYRSRFFFYLNNTERWQPFVYICQGIFILCFLYTLMIMILNIKRVFDDQIMMVNKIFPIIDAKAVKLNVASKLQEKSTGASTEIDIVTSIFCTLGGTDYLSSMMSPQEIFNQSLMFNQKTNSIFERQDFRILTSTNYYQEILPSTFMRYDLPNQEIWIQQKLKDSNFERQFLKQQYEIDNNDLTKFLDDQVQLSQNTSVLDKVIKQASDIKGIRHTRHDDSKRQSYLQDLKQILDSIQIRSPDDRERTTGNTYNMSPNETDQGEIHNRVDKLTLDVSKFESKQEAAEQREVAKPQLKKKVAQAKEAPPQVKEEQKTTGPTLTKKQKKLIQQQQEKAKEEELKASIEQARQQEALLKEKEQKEKALLEQQAQEEDKKEDENIEDEEAKDRDKKTKIRKLTKTELKKQQQRLKKEKELIESTKRAEIAAAEQKVREEKIKQAQLEEQRKKAELEKERHEQETAHLKDIILKPTLKQDEPNEDAISFQSYHSDHDNSRDTIMVEKKKAKPKPVKPEEKQTTPKKLNEKSTNEKKLAVKNEQSPKAKPPLAANMDFWQNYEKSIIQKSTQIKDNEQKPEQQPEATHKQEPEPVSNINTLVEQLNKTEITVPKEEKPTKNTQQIVAKPEQLSKVEPIQEKLEAFTPDAQPDQKEQPVTQPETTPSVAEEQAPKPTDKKEEAANALVETSEQPGTPDNNQSKDQPTDSICPMSGEKIVLSEKDSDSDSSLPLFQQKKYIAKQMEIQQKIQKDNETKGKKEDPDKKADARDDRNMSAKAAKRQEDERNIRKVYEKQKHEEKIKDKNMKLQSLLPNSKNPNADYNNPNNPNYKGRLTNKIIDTYLPKQKQKPQIYKEREEPREDSYDRRDHETKRKKQYTDTYQGYFNDELDDRDYPYADDNYYQNYPHADYYNDDPRYGRYIDERERYSRFNQPEFYQGRGAPQRGRGRAKARGGLSSYQTFDDMYYGDRRGFASKYYPQDDKYGYYDDHLKYDKKRADWVREDSRDYEARPEITYADKYKEELKTEDYFVNKYGYHDQLKKGSKVAKGQSYVESQDTYQKQVRAERGAGGKGQRQQLVPKDKLLNLGKKSQEREAFQFKTRKSDSGSNEHQNFSIDTSNTPQNIGKRGNEDQQPNEFKYVQKIKNKNESANQTHTHTVSGSFVDTETKPVGADQNTSSEKFSIEQFKNAGDGSDSKPSNEHQGQSNDQQVMTQEEEGENEQDESGFRHMDSNDMDLNLLTKSIHEAMNSRDVSENEEQKQDKSVYQMYMDVSSIFTKNFGEKQKQKQMPRFISQQMYEQSLEDEHSPVNFEAKNSIFSSSNLFSNRNNSSQVYGQPNPSNDFRSESDKHAELSQQLYMMLNQNFMNQQFVQPSTSPFSQQKFGQQYQNEFDQEYGTNMYGEYAVKEAYQPQTTGLSMSAFANLRKRALDAGRDKSNASSLSNQNARESNEPAAQTSMFTAPLKNITQPTLIDNSKPMFPSLDVQPFPRFMQNRISTVESKPGVSDGEDDFNKVFGQALFAQGYSGRSVEKERYDNEANEQSD